MTHDEFIDQFGEPKNWELATAILEQIESYQTAAALLMRGTPPKVHPAAAILLGPLKGDGLDSARDRVRRPVIDLDDARAMIGPIGESGGWTSFVPFA